MPRFVLGKVRKFQDPSSNRLGDIQEKPEGWIKTTPPATNRVKGGSFPLTLLVAGSWLPLLVAGGGCLGPPLEISGSYRSIFKIQTAFVSPQYDLHF